MRTHLALKARKHIEFFLLVKGKVAASVHVLSSAGPTNRR
jgi:hypothetical protein